MKLVVIWFLSLTCRSQTIPMFGNTTLGYYYVNVFLGQNAEPQSLIFDTGSDKTLTDCEACHACGKHIHPHYNSNAHGKNKIANGFENFVCFDDGCRFDQGYSEGSAYRGDYILDIFPTPIDSAAIQGIVPNTKTSICLAADGGQLSIGDMNWSLHLPGQAVQSIKADERMWSDQYKLNLHNVFVGDKSVGYNFDLLNDWDQQGFFDTGTTFVYFQVEVYDKISNSFREFCEEKNENCGSYSKLQSCFRNGWLSSQSDDEFIATFPTLKFKFDSPNLYRWKPQDYLVKSNNYDFCITFASGDSLIYGASFFKNHDVLLDKENFEVKFVEADCAGSPQKYRHMSAKSNGYNDRFNQLIADYNSNLGILLRIEGKATLMNLVAIAILGCVLVIMVQRLRTKREGVYDYSELVEIN